MILVCRIFTIKYCLNVSDYYSHICKALAYAQDMHIFFHQIEKNVQVLASRPKQDAELSQRNRKELHTIRNVVVRN